MKEDHKRILVTSALPYANGPSHIGRLTGAYLPADIYVRFQRMMGRDIVYICGSDEHGVPITIQAEKEGVSPQALVDRYHAMIQDEFRRMGISFDHYSRTSSAIHKETAQEFFLDLLSKDVLLRKPEMQWYDEKAARFLSDRYVEGTCPVCGNNDARGDQCEKCGTYLNQMQLKNPRSKITGNVPVARETTHWYLPLGNYQADLEKWIATKTDWKDNVINYCRGWFQQKLGDRAITRDLDWGVAVPKEIKGRPIEGANGKVLYVWFEAVLGYISATKEWAAKTGQPETWRTYWQDEETKLVHFIGKDNIVFHALMFPAITMAYNQGKTSDRFVLVSEVPACEFLNLEGAKLSTSRNHAVWVKDYLAKFPPDPLRYTLTCILPESKDSDFSWKDFQARNNNELADILGNLINRCLSFTVRNFEGRVPEAGALDRLDEQTLEAITTAADAMAKHIESFRFRDACRSLMDLARIGNKFFNDREPWKDLKSDRIRCATTVFVSIQVVYGLAALMSPIMPFTAKRVWTMLGLGGEPAALKWQSIGKTALPSGSPLGKVEIVFSKIDDDVIQQEIDKLMAGESAGQNQPLAGIEDFSKVEMRTAIVLAAERVEGTTKLLKIQIDLGSEKRQIVSGLAEHYEPAALVGKAVIVLTNLKPAKIRGVESNGMLLTAGSGKELVILTTERSVKPGSKIS